MTPHATITRAAFLTPSLTKQSVYFIIGGSLFAVGSAASIWDFAGVGFTNWCCFIGAWFFTTAGLFQVVLSGDATVPGRPGQGKALRAEWLAAATQSFGTILFNVSTTTALTAKSVSAEKHYMWNPDAGGSVAFLISAFFVYVAFYRSEHTLWEPRSSGWWSAHINMLGCIAFAVSAVGAFVLSDGSSKDAPVANWGTFIGAVCFVLASAVVLPQAPWNRAQAVRAATAAPSPAGA
ncbi:hypothetical protein [Leucobacter luti]|uniref:YrhK-like protein n=1 Tax=Leucobacter luti TaxID=340320 RepID=A0A4V6MCI7_9MICO|nr:hypothetical protein [Leucobacter luti]MBL3698208.1 hypothetical protein [Leucobacter luti]RZT64709.1 hypothetical protein EV139_2132 [Leucobacter luti]